MNVKNSLPGLSWRERIAYSDGWFHWVHVPWCRLTRRCRECRRPLHSGHKSGCSRRPGKGLRFTATGELRDGQFRLRNITERKEKGK